ncbi:MAG: hypothetical protein JXE07_08790 [Candidatus Aminicenantes bacterium]|nr:hypothetical protein [Candidatus Aminicenantes bacterium]
MKLKNFFVLLIFSTLSVCLSAQDVVVLGAPGQEGELASPRGIHEGPDGNIYVYDEADAFIKVYSPQGQFLRKMGGEGQGPGEIQRRDGVSFGFTRDGKLFFTEYFRGHRWITLLELDGELAKVIKIDLSGSFGIGDAVALDNGSFLAEFHFLGEPEQRKDYFLYKSPIKLLRLDPEGKVVAEIRAAEHRTRISFIPDGADSPIPFVPVFAWCLHKGQIVLFSEGLSPSLEAIDLDGKPLPEIRTELHKPQKVRDKDLDRWREERKRSMMERNPGWWHRSGRVVEKYTKSIYEFRPLLGGLESTPEDRVLVSGAWDIDRQTHDCWLIDISGKVVAKLSQVQGRITLTRGFVFGVTSDPIGNVAVKWFKRLGNEKDDFLGSARLLQR